MIVITTDAFIKSFKKLKNPSLDKQLDKVVKIIENATTISDIPNYKKMIGFTTHHRIRMGDYRIGVTIVETTVTLIVIAHRKDIYNLFP